MVSLSTKVSLLKTMAWSTMTSGCESGTLNMRDEERIRAFEMLGLCAFYACHGQPNAQTSGYLKRLELVDLS